MRACCGEALQEFVPVSVAAARFLQWLGPRDKQVAQLAESGAFGVNCSLSSCDERLQRLPLPARARGVDGRSFASAVRAARIASKASVLPPVRRSRRSRPKASSTRSRRPVRKRVSPRP